MARGETTQSKIHYKSPNDEDFIIFIEDIDEYEKWKTDKSVPMVNFISSYKIFVTGKQGNQGTLSAASHATLDNEFGTHVDDEVIKAILEKGDLIKSEMPERTGNRNDSQGARAAH